MIPDPDLQRLHASEQIVENGPDTPVRFAASLILVRRSASVLEVLMGRRSAKATFMPSRLVYPGGRLEPEDEASAAGAAALCADHARMAAHISQQTAAGLPHAALRETREETGLTVAPASLRLVMRAITPPNRVRRFDTWFFLHEMDMDQSEPTAPPDGELEDVSWRTEEAVRAQDLHPITEIALNAALARLDPASLSPPPFIRVVDGAFRNTPLWAED